VPRASPGSDAVSETVLHAGGEGQVPPESVPRVGCLGARPIASRGGPNTRWSSGVSCSLQGLSVLGDRNSGAGD
jgi:hypothetical protein